MPRTICDHNIPFILTLSLPACDITHASQLGWQELSNGRLLAAAEETGFDVLITADQNIQHQQNLTARKLALIVLDTNHWPTLKPHLDSIEAAIVRVEVGGYLSVAFPRLPLKRRVFGPGSNQT
jgi:hypothetical protein